jgi:hypothetical protein
MFGLNMSLAGQSGRFSKNLFNPAVGSITANGVTCTVATGGTITLNGTATANTRFCLTGATLQSSNDLGFADQYLAPIKIVPYTLSSSQIIPSNMFVYVREVNVNLLTLNNTLTNTQTPITLDHISYVFIRVVSGAAFTNFSFKLQLEQNTVATAWEQY